MFAYTGFCDPTFRLNNPSMLYFKDAGEGTHHKNGASKRNGKETPITKTVMPQNA